MYYITMQITFPIPDFARKERNLHCDIVHVTTKWVSRLVLDRSDPDVAIKAYRLYCVNQFSKSCAKHTTVTFKTTNANN